MKIDKNKEYIDRKIPSFFEDQTTPYTIENFEKRRKELLQLFAKYEYGKTPKGPFKVEGFTNFKRVKLGGKAIHEKITIGVIDQTENVNFSFPLELITPINANKDTPVPLILHFSFGESYNFERFPVEEIIDRNVAVATVYYEDVAIDEGGKMDIGVDRLYSKQKYDWGKISKWAWAGSRALDFLLKDERFNLDKIASLGHSRLGKTSLWLGANDERVKYVFACQSGCSGDALLRGKKGENLELIANVFPFWFTPKFQEFKNNEDKLPFEQYMLIACCYPRKVYGSSAELDGWADPKSQFLSYIFASNVYEKLGKKGIDFNKTDLTVGDVFNTGDLAYHLSPGLHFLSRYDWNKYIDFLLK